MKILWCTWKDMKHPLAGGAEVVNEELAKRLVAGGHEVVFLVAGYDHSKDVEERDGFKIIRVGGRWSVYYKAYRYYKAHLKSWPDLVIDEVNTIPFFSKFYVKQKNVLFVHQLCRKVWFYQMFFPLNVIGYIIEPLYLRTLNDRTVITVSESTKKELLQLGFRQDKVHIISEGIQINPLEDLTLASKYEVPTILALGAVRPMKRTIDTVKAFEIFAKSHSTAQLVIAGDNTGPYAEKMITYIKKSPYSSRIVVRGRVSREEKIQLMQRSHLISVTSVKEGWGLIVTEANSQGTPAVVYDVDGLRDSVIDGLTGYVCKINNPKCMASNMVSLINNGSKRREFSLNAWNLSKDITFDKSYIQFLSAIK